MNIDTPVRILWVSGVERGSLDVRGTVDPQLPTPIIEENCAQDGAMQWK
jgi:hypothetical protein